MATKADLRVILGLDKAGFDRSLASATASVNRFSRQTGAAGKQMKALLGNAGIGGLAKMSPYIAGAAALGKAIGDIVTNGRALETSMAHLQSLTGLSSDVMGNVKQMATDTAMAVGISSDQIIDAYGVIGSKMPELLKSPEALNKVAEAAATLAKAGVMPLEDSIESLTGIMNQMGASANEAEVYINVLAAGSKNGAGNIEYLATAFTKAGSAIKNAGLSVQEGTALIEALAKRMPDAAEAGTALRNVLLVLSTTAGDELNPKIVGLDKAMENLHARIGDTNEMVKLFGKRNYTAAAILADSTEQVKSMTDAVTGTTEAYDQAAINGQTLDAQLNRLDASWKTLTASIGESCGWLADFIKLINEALEGMAHLMSYDATQHDLEYRSDQTKTRADSLIEINQKHGGPGGSALTRRQAIQKTINTLRSENEQAYRTAISLENRWKNLEAAGRKGSDAYKQLYGEWSRWNNQIKAYNAEIKRLQGMLDAPAEPPAPPPTPPPTPRVPRRGGGRFVPTKQEPDYVPGSLKDYEAQLNKLNNELQKNVDVTALSEEQLKTYAQKFSELYEKIDAAKKALKQFDKASESLKPVTDELKPGELSSRFTAPEATKGIKGLKLPSQNMIKEQVQLNREIERTNELYGEMGRAMGDVGGMMMESFANVVNAITILKSNLKDTSGAIGSMGAALSAAGSAISAIGQAAEEKGLAIGGLIAQTIGNLALSFAMAMKGAGELGPIGWAAFGVAGMAQLIAMIAQIKSMTSGYASGGIIPGNSYHGDQMYVRANAGEMILTQGQQSRLFRLLDGGAYNAGAGQVEFVINGSQLKGVLNNYSRKTGKLA
jgi:TP901 family phage tail tape measure protein